MEVGVVYDPCSDELFQTVRGFGAFLNGQRVSSSGCKELGNAVVVRRGVTHGGCGQTPKAGTGKSVVLVVTDIIVGGSCLL